MGCHLGTLFLTSPRGFPWNSGILMWMTDNILFLIDWLVAMWDLLGFRLVSIVLKIHVQS